MTDRTEVTAAQIARIAGVGRAAVSNWRKRHADFPAPVGGSETSPTFSLRAVEEWLRAEGKLSETPADELLWRAVDAAGGTAEATAAVLTGLGRALAGAADSADADPALDPALVSQASNLAEADGRGEVFERLQERYVSEYMRNRDTGSVNEPLARLMADLAAPTRTSASAPPALVYDPCCGAGSLLAAAARRGATSLVGQTSESALVPLVNARLTLLADDLSIDIRPGDAMLDDAHPALAADAVLCQPPTTQREWGFDDLAYDPRWEYGMPPRAESELAWVQHALARLRPGGTAVLLLPPGVAARRPGRRIRAELLRRGALRAVIGLPAAWAAPYGPAPQLWILRRPEPVGSAPNHLLFLDRSSPADVADAAETADRILAAWHAFERSPAAAVEPGFSAVLPIIELLDDVVDLSPARHVPRPETGLGREELLENRATVQSVLAQLAVLLPELGPDPSPGLPWPMTTLGDLARTQALEILSDTAVAPGDILVPILGGALGQAVVVADGDPLVGTNTARGVAALRPDPALLDPWFVAGFLRSDAAARQSVSHASTTSRMDIRKAPLPRLPLNRQRAYATAFRRIVEFSETLRLVADLGERFARGVTDALAEGTALPSE